MAKLFWLAFIAAHPVCAWFGYVEGVEGARNVLAFFVVVLHFTLAVLSIASAKDSAKRPAASLAWRATWRVCTYSTLGILIWFGAWGTGGFLAVAALLREAAQRAADVKRAEMAAAN